MGMVTLFRKQIFDFTFLGVGSQTITIKRSLAIIPFYYYWLGVRVHNRVIGTGSFTLNLPNTLPSSQDPQEFTESGTPALSVQITSGTAVPSLLIDTTTFLGPYVKVTMTATQVGAGQQLYTELSAVLFSRKP
ncbi:MAG TPA: hypothetical protein VG755_12325 [Nannocystaceae bacterium]|nr:hypothetical protein [Nannocystaceae bacterium]